jgi:hypothetical protein
VYLLASVRGYRRNPFERAASRAAAAAVQAARDEQTRRA